jgi:hypothetical protein
VYARNRKQQRRKQNYIRFEKLTSQGYSVSDETASNALYVVNSDPFGRAYYTKPLGEAIKRDPVTGRKYSQEEWATKEYIIDNKTQLINKVSADLVVGKDVEIGPEYPDEVSDEDKDWLRDFIKKNKLVTMLYEGAIQNSAKGDYYFEITIGDAFDIEVIEIDPYYVDIDHTNKRVNFYEIAHEFEIAKPRKFLRIGSNQTKKITYVQKKVHYPGKIVYKLLEKDGEDYNPVPLNINPENKKLFDRVEKSKHIKMYVSLDPITETDDIDAAFFIIEFTGIDTPLLVHWPNYRMFDIFGVSDTGMVESLQNALNNRETQLNDILDKHADPSMYGPDSYLDEYGNLEMSGGGSRYFPVVDGMTPPGYLTWSGHLPEAHKEIERIYHAILENSEVSPALVGNDQGGIQSGRALMYKLIRSLCMASRKSVYMHEAIGEVIKTAQKMRQVWVTGKGVDNPENYAFPEFDDIIFDVVVTSRSSIPTDRTSTIDDVAKLVDKGLLTVDTGVLIIAKLFDEVDADEEIERLLQAAQEKLNQEKELRKAEIPDYLKSEPRDGEPGNKKSNENQIDDNDQVIKDDTKIKGEKET